MRSKKPVSPTLALAQLGSASRAIVAVSACSRGGSVSDLGRLVDVNDVSVRQRLSSLRRAGIARWIDVYAPAKTGYPIETRTYVKLRDLSPSSLEAFEAHCLSDPRVASAAMISGSFGYVLTTLHATHAEARAWAWELASRDNVHDVDQRLVVTRFGHLLPGTPWFR